MSLLFQVYNNQKRKSFMDNKIFLKMRLMFDVENNYCCFSMKIAFISLLWLLMKYKLRRLKDTKVMYW